MSSPDNCPYVYVPGAGSWTVGHVPKTLPDFEQLTSTQVDNKDHENTTEVAQVDNNELENTTQVVQQPVNKDVDRSNKFQPKRTRINNG